jgi:hypothetical protein
MSANTGSLDMAVLYVQNVVTSNGKHTVGGEQHELTTHTSAFGGQSFVIRLHGIKIEQRIPGAQ